MIFHSEVTIWKDPVTAMQRTKAMGLLHKTIRTNRAMTRQGFADYLVTMRKPGEAEERIEGLLDCYVGEQLNEDFNRWCYAEFERQKQKYVESEMSFQEFRSHPDMAAICQPGMERYQPFRDAATRIGPRRKG